jgi:feruloyl esterase
MLIINATGLDAGQGRGFPGAAPPSDTEAACRDLMDIGALTITFAEFRSVNGSPDQYCQVRGMIAPGIRYHVDLPLPSRWNRRLIGFGDGSTDGVVFSTSPFIQQRVQQGYAVVNSNSGHDDAVEPGASFGFNNRQAEIDYGYRAVHLTTLAAKWIARVYYGSPPAHSYFDGCSNGGRQALMEAQRFSDDYDGLLVGAPNLYSQAQHVNHVWLLQKTFAKDFADNLAFDSNGDGVPEDLTKLNILAAAVLEKCDSVDGIKDGVIEDPRSCQFRPAVDLARHACPGSVNGPSCFTRGQLRLIEDAYRGAYDSRGRQIIKGFALGSEPAWAFAFLPHAGNKLRPVFLSGSGDYINYLFYEDDPGVLPPDLTRPARGSSKGAVQREYGWWEFNVDHVTAGRGAYMARILDASSPDLTAFASNKKRKLLMYHGWSDHLVQPEPSIDYYEEVVRRTFGGSVEAAREQFRLFMLPGMEHCGGGPGPGDWGDKLQTLVDWVEDGRAPDFLTVHHRSGGVIDNERKVCAYPQRSVYTGPTGQGSERTNWTAGNFACQ